MEVNSDFDLELDSYPQRPASIADSDQNFESDSNSNSDESDADPDCHPILELNEDFLPDTDSADTLNDTLITEASNVPEVVQLLWKQLLSNYRPPNHPPIIDYRGCSLTEVEVLSLKHYLAWVDSGCTVKAYGLHAKLLEEVTNMELLSLYKA